MGTNSHTELSVLQRRLRTWDNRLTRRRTWKYLVLNVQFVVFPCLERLVEASVTFYRVIHENRAPSRHKRQTRVTHMRSETGFRNHMTAVNSATCRWLWEQQVAWVCCWWWVWLWPPCRWTPHPRLPPRSTLLSSSLWPSCCSWSPGGGSPPQDRRRTGLRPAQRTPSGPSASWRRSYWTSSLNKTRQRDLNKMRTKGRVWSLSAEPHDDVDDWRPAHGIKDRDGSGVKTQWLNSSLSPEERRLTCLL